MVYYSHHSSIARAVKRGDRLAIDYSGPMTLDSINKLERMVLPDKMMTLGAFERIDSALTMWTRPVEVCRINYPSGTPPSAVIVRPDQYARSLEFCALLERCGVIRTCWLPEQTVIADLWLAQFARPCREP